MSSRWRPRAPRQSRRDAGEQAIVDALRSAGALVYRLDAKDLPDLMVLVRGWVLLLEIKRPPGPRGGTSKDGQKLRPGQDEFRELARTADVEVYVVTSPEGALAVMGALP